MRDALYYNEKFDFTTEISANMFDYLRQGKKGQEEEDNKKR